MTQEKSIIERFDLTKSSLIEASAGTGKTYTITYLVLRLLLGIHQIDKSIKIKENKNLLEFLAPKSIEDILVVTFTNAATDELKRKILEKIRYARIFFEILDGLDKSDIEGNENIKIETYLEYLKNTKLFEDSLINIVQMLVTNTDKNFVSYNILVTKKDKETKARALTCKDYINVLKKAEISIDKAPICTIHSFCNRILNQIYTFDAGEAFQIELLNNNDKQLKEALYNVWRKVFYNIPSENRVIFEYLDVNKPEDLVSVVNEIQSVRTSFNKEGVQNIFGYNIEGISIEDQDADLITIIENKIKKFSYSVTDTLYELFLKKGCVIQNIQELLDNGEFEKAENMALDIAKKQRITDIVRDNAKYIIEFIRTYDRTDNIQEFFSKNKKFIDFYLELEKVKTQNKLPDFKFLSKEIKYLIAIYIQERTDALSYRDKVMFNDDLLRKLDRALNENEKDNSLVKKIRKRYPVALIDEFQDTDPIQFSIFNRIYLADDNDVNACCYLIGDDKQAIYSFRGSDINSYVKAKKAIAFKEDGSSLQYTDENIYRLGTNFRSTKDNIESVNILFGNRFISEYTRDKAFSFANNDETTDDKAQITYNPVNGVNEALIYTKGDDNSIEQYICGTEVNYIELQNNLAFHEPSRKNGKEPKYIAGLNKDEAALVYAKKCAFDIYNLLKKGYIKEKGHERKIKESDITILVSDASENNTIQKELNKYNLKSVYYSNKDSVITTTKKNKNGKDVKSISICAQAMIFFMQAMCDSRSIRNIRRCLASMLLALNADEYMDLIQDENFEKEILLIKRCKDTWSNYGLQAAFTHFFENKHHNSLRRYLNSTDGLRVISDLYQISEIIQTVHGKISGINAQLRWFKDLELNEEIFTDVEVKKRLESEVDLIKIYTIHKSKGLEFPIVFAPFLWNVSNIQKKLANKSAILYFNEEKGCRFLQIDKQEKAQKIYEISTQEEYIRLIYVALTRARYANFLYITEIQQSGFCALKSLLERFKREDVLQDTKQKKEAANTKKLFECLETHMKKDEELLEQKLNIMGFRTFDYENDDLYIKAQSNASIKDLASFSLDKKDRDTQLSLNYLNKGDISRDFTISSYSKITKGLHDNAISIAKDHNFEEQEEAVFALDEEKASQYKDSINVIDDVIDINNLTQEHIDYAKLSFPRGTSAGTFIHALYENLDFSLKKQNKKDFYAEDSYLFRYVQRCIEIYGLDLVNKWVFFDREKYKNLKFAENIKVKILIRWLLDVIKTPLFVSNDKAYSLDMLKENTWLSELRFLMPVFNSSSSIIDDINHITYDLSTKIFHEDLFDDLKKRELNRNTLAGFTTGSIDLVAMFDNKYYVMDYKTNYLGDKSYSYLSKYIALNVFDATTRYDVQFLLYTLALHRFLKTRIVDYDYDRDVGGVCYLYLRGMKAFSLKESKDKMQESSLSILNKSKTSILNTDMQLLNNVGKNTYQIDDKLNFGVFHIKIEKDLILRLDDLFTNTESAEEDK